MNVQSPYSNVNVPAFCGAGAVSVNVLDQALTSPTSARSVPKAVMRVLPAAVVTVPVPWAPPLWTKVPVPEPFTQKIPVKFPVCEAADRK
jgi:hypothetical protein